MHALLMISDLASSTLSTLVGSLSSLHSSALSTSASAASFFNGMFSGDFFWDYPIFQKQEWEHWMNVTRLMLTFGGSTGT